MEHQKNETMAGDPAKYIPINRGKNYDDTK